MKYLVLSLCVLSSVPALAQSGGEFERRNEMRDQQLEQQMQANEQAMYDREHQAIAEAIGGTFVATRGGYGPGEYWINGGQIVCGYTEFGIGCVDAAGNPAPQYAPSAAKIKAAMAKADGHPAPVQTRRHR